MTESTQRDPIDSQFPRIVSRQSSKIMIDRPILSTVLRPPHVEDGATNLPAPRSRTRHTLFTPMQSKKYTVIVELGTFVTRDSFWGRKFRELSFNVCLSLCAQPSRLKNFALARFSLYFSLCADKRTIRCCKRAERRKSRVRPSDQESRKYIMFCMCFFLLSNYRDYWKVNFGQTKIIVRKSKYFLGKKLKATVINPRSWIDYIALPITWLIDEMTFASKLSFTLCFSIRHARDTRSWSWSWSWRLDDARCVTQILICL